MARVGPSYRVGDEDGDLSHLVFSVLSAEEKRALSVCEIFDPRAWTNNFPCNNGPHDQRMGSTNRSLVCPTCHETNCHGHPGRIEFAEPVYHVLMLKILAKLFRCVCIFCAQPRFLIKHEPCKGYEPVECEGKVLYIERKLALLRGRDPKQCLKTLSAFLDKRDCVNPECKMPQPKIKSTALELEHAYSSLVLKKMPRQAQEAMRRPLSSFEYRSILKHVPHDAYLVLGFRPSVSHPSDMIMENFLVPPPGVRPPLRLQEGAKTKSEHDMTKFIVAILHANNELTQLKTDGSARDKLYLAWQMLQLQVSRFIAFKKVKKVKLRGMERDKRKQAQTVPQDMEKILAGKQGRFRKNLSGKRCNRSARAPVAPDVQRDVWELGVPRQMFTTLTVPTRVTAFNLSEMQESVRKGEGVLGGAESVREPDPSFQSKEITHSLSNKTSEQRDELASMLQLGWTVERYLREGDLVIFNRQPTLHKESIQAFRAYMHDDETFKLNLIDTTPFNADYDGDEMNMHVIGDVQAETEMQELLLVPHQIVSSQSNRPCMGLVHDGLVGFFMMTRRDEFFERNEVFRLVSRLKYAHKTLKRPRGVLQDYFNEQEAGFLDTLQLPPPAVLKPVPLWTGKQIASMLIPDLNWVGKIKPVPLHVLPEETDRRALVEEALSNSELDPLDLQVVVRRGELLKGQLCRETLAARSNALHHLIFKEYGGWPAARFLSDAQRLAMDYMYQRSISFGLSDVCIDKESRMRVKLEQSQALAHVEKMMQLEMPQDFRESMTLRTMNECTNRASAVILKKRGPLHVIAESGAKGSALNLAQLSVALGQQTVEGQRPLVRHGRTLPYFKAGRPRPMERGYGSRALSEGLAPAEYFFHAQAGRAGLIDTAVKTSESGDLQRHLVNGLAGCTVDHARSVRNADGSLVQFLYGDDAYDAQYLVDVVLPAPESVKDSFEAEGWGELGEELERMLRTLVDLRRSSQTPKPSMLFRLPFRLDTLTLGSCPAQPHHVRSLMRRMDAATNPDACAAAKAHLVWECRPARGATLEILEEAERQFMQALASPGDPAGATAASSLGEPTTQMTLNTFHFTGVGEKNATLGLPRLKALVYMKQAERINNVFRPLPLFRKAPVLMSMCEALESTKLGQLVTRTSISDASEMDERQARRPVSRVIRFDLSLKKLWRSGLTAERVARALQFYSYAGWVDWSAPNSRENWIKVALFSKRDTMRQALEEFAKKRGQHYSALETELDALEEDAALIVSQQLLKCPVKGLDNVKDVEMDAKNLQVHCVGSCMSRLRGFPGVDSLSFVSNNVLDNFECYGVEAGEAKFVGEMTRVLSFDGCYVNARHLKLLGSMLFRMGRPLALNRFNLREMGVGVLASVAFQQAVASLGTAAAYGEEDPLRGVIENVIVGRRVPVGTGAVEVRDVRPQIPVHLPSILAPLNFEAIREEQMYDEGEWMAGKARALPWVGTIGRRLFQDLKDLSNSVCLNVRLGRVGAEGFVPGASAEIFEALETYLDRQSSWQSSTERFLQHDFLMEHTERTELRQIVVMEKDGVLKKTSLAKEKLSHYTLRAGAYDLSVVSDVENPVDPASLPAEVKAACRIKVRRLFQSRVWSVALTRMWVGATFRDCHATLRGAPLLDIKVFLHDPLMAHTRASLTAEDLAYQGPMILCRMLEAAGALPVKEETDRASSIKLQSEFHWSEQSE